MSAMFLYGRLTLSFVMILVFLSGSVSFEMDATVFDLEILWNVLSTSMSSISYRSILMLWVLQVCDPLLEHYLDLECLPLLGRWLLSVLLPRAGVLPLCRSWPLPLLRVDLEQELKWFLKPHLWHFLPNAGQSLYECIVLHLLYVLLSLLLGPLALCELLALVPFLPHLNVLIASIVVGCAIPPLDFWRLKSLTLSHAPWHIGVVLGMSHPLIASLISPISSLQSAWWHEKEVQFYVPVSHLSSTGIFRLGSWLSDQVGRLTHCLLVLCHCISHQYDSSMMLRLQGYQLWPWKLSLDLLGFIICWDR